MMQKLYLPALKGYFGDWVYYSCLMPLPELAARVSFASDLQQLNEGNRGVKLSKLLQRKLEQGREREIATYLRENEQRFFNSLVLAVYGGNPSWHEINTVAADSDEVSIDDIPESTLNSVGFLSFDNEAKIFAIDGQHRLTGVKEAIATGVGLDDDEVSVILVAHKETSRGRQRTRRLFTTLNKTAKSVSKGDIIALDEDDVMALCVRRLVAEHPYFAGDRILITPTNNIPKSNTECFTTIGNLYDVLGILFSKSDFDLCRPLTELKHIRPSDSELDDYYRYSVQFFECLGRNFPTLQTFFESERYARMKKRGPNGGHILFRPIGLTVFTEIVAALTLDYTLSDSVEMTSYLPQVLSDPPYDGILYDVARDKMLPGGKTVLRDLLMYLLGMNVDTEKLQSKLATLLGRPAKSDSILEEYQVVFDE